MMNSDKTNACEIKDNDIANLHPIFTRDPAEWMNILNKQVQVSTEDGLQHLGYVYTVDPVSETVVLVNHADNPPSISPKMAMKLLIGSSITDLKIISDTTDTVRQSFEYLFRPARDETLSDEALQARKVRLKSWLEKHRLPVTVGGVEEKCLTVADALTIQPPYTEDSCLSTNEIILSRIQGLIKNMPADHETW